MRSFRETGRTSQTGWGAASVFASAPFTVPKDRSLGIPGGWLVFRQVDLVAPAGHTGLVIFIQFLEEVGVEMAILPIR